MKTLLVLARGEAKAYQTLDGGSVFDDVPVPLVLFADRGNHASFAPLKERGVEIQVVRWSDQSDIAARAAALHAERGLIGIACTDEMAMDLAGRLRAALGLPGLDVEATARFRDKRRMKAILGAAGVRVPVFRTCDDRAAVEDLLARFGRIVIKPFDGLGSKAVEFINDAAALAAWYAAATDPAHFQADEFIDGTLYHVNAVVVDGAPRLTIAAPYLPGMANIDFASGAPFVSRIERGTPLAARLEAFSDSVVAALGLADGVTHLECFVTAADEIIFCEIGARPGGDDIVWMMEADTGVNYVRAAILLEAGASGLIPFPAGTAADDVAGLMGFRWPSNAFIRAIADRGAFADTGILRYETQYKPGDFVPACGHCTDYIGLVIFRSPTADRFEDRRRDLFDRFYDRLTVENA